MPALVLPEAAVGRGLHRSFGLTEPVLPDEDESLGELGLPVNVGPANPAAPFTSFMAELSAQQTEDLICHHSFTRLDRFCKETDHTATLRLMAEKQSPLPTISGSCAVVGAGGQLKGSKKGEEIDRHDTVLRINQSPLHRFKEDVGERTTARIMSMDMFSTTERYVKIRKNHTYRAEVPYIVGCYGPFRGRCHTSRFRQMIGGEQKTFLMDPAVPADAVKRFPKTTNQRSPTTGFIGIELALRSCRVVDVYGFATGPCPRVCYHYYDPATKCAQHQSTIFDGMRSSRGFHNYSAQVAVLEHLNATGAIRWKDEQCLEEDPPNAELPLQTLQKVCRPSKGRPCDSKGSD
jgi:hypothetical protein